MLTHIGAVAILDIVKMASALPRFCVMICNNKYSLIPYIITMAFIK